MGARINPSILAADFVNLQRDVASIASADFVHVDVMDNHFVPNLTFGLQMVFRMNHLAPPFDNPKIRQAIRHMVDQNSFVTALVNDPAFYKVCPSFYMCSSPYFTDAGAVLSVSWMRPRISSKSAACSGSVVRIAAAA